MLPTELKDQLQRYLKHVTQPIELITHLDNSVAAREMADLLSEIVQLSNQVSIQESLETTTRKPAFFIRNPATGAQICFAAIPMGHEFTSLILALLQIGGHPPKIEAAVIDQIKALEGPLYFETFISLSCQSCPDVVQALNTMAALNPNITQCAIDGALFQEEVTQKEIMAVPSVFLNGKPFAQGRMVLEEILSKLDVNSNERAQNSIDARPPYDVLIVGGGPAAAAAAIYAARKGIRTGVLAERFGGQVLDTLSIENYISVAHTQGPQFAAALERHVRQYEVDLINHQQATQLIPASLPGKLHSLILKNGARLQTRTLILCTGARWRSINVPGEVQYRNRGVAYCPHCDGPLYKGRRVAVIGGGNSGVEAAIDLAGIAQQVTLLEFAPQMRADAVLGKKLESLSNVRIHTNVQTTEITGDGSKVNGIAFTDRENQQKHHIELDGIFVQIGLIPNSDWLKETLPLSRHGEIEVDAKCQTTLPGIFAAGDVTTVPFKQIIIAAGEGAKAALSAFDYLIRTPASID